MYFMCDFLCIRHSYRVRFSICVNAKRMSCIAKGADEYRNTNETIKNERRKTHARITLIYRHLAFWRLSAEREMISTVGVANAANYATARRAAATCASCHIRWSYAFNINFQLSFRCLKNKVWRSKSLMIQLNRRK